MTAADRTDEFDCVECGQHVVRMIARAEGEPALCAICVNLPGWVHDPKLQRIYATEPEDLAAIASRSLWRTTLHMRLQGGSAIGKSCVDIPELDMLKQSIRVKGGGWQTTRLYQVGETDYATLLAACSAIVAKRKAKEGVAA